MRPAQFAIVAVSVLAFFLIAESGGQEPTKPAITSVTALPSDPILTTGICTSSRSGYLEAKGRTKLTKAEIGDFIQSSLSEGYAVTIYPETKNGIFVDMECVAANRITASKAP